MTNPNGVPVERVLDESLSRAVNTWRFDLILETSRKAEEEGRDYFIYARDYGMGSVPVEEWTPKKCESRTIISLITATGEYIKY